MRKRERQAQELIWSQDIEALEKQLCADIDNENFKLKNDNLQLKKIESLLR